MHGRRENTLSGGDDVCVGGEYGEYGSGRKGRMSGVGDFGEGGSALRMMGLGGRSCKSMNLVPFLLLM